LKVRGRRPGVESEQLRNIRFVLDLLEELQNLRTLYEEFNQRLIVLEERLSIQHEKPVLSSGSKIAEKPDEDVPPPVANSTPPNATAISLENQTQSPPVTSPVTSPRSKTPVEDDEPKVVPTSELKVPQKVRKVVELLLQYHSVALAVMETAPSGEIDSTASSVLHLFDSQRTLTNLLLSSIDHEVSNAST
jgi:hypothetical protein